MDLPRSRARLADLIRVIGIPHKPSGNTNLVSTADERTNCWKLPGSHHRPHSRRNLNDNCPTAILVRRLALCWNNPHMPVVPIVGVDLAVGRLRSLLNNADEVPFEGDRWTFVASDF